MPRAAGDDLALECFVLRSSNEARSAREPLYGSDGPGPRSDLASVHRVAGGFSRMLLVLLWLSFLYGSYNGAMVVALTEIVPSAVRTAGFSLADALATALFGGFTPLLSTWLIEATHNKAAPGLWLAFAGACGASATFVLYRRAAIAKRAEGPSDEPRPSSTLPMRVPISLSEAGLPRASPHQRSPLASFVAFRPAALQTRCIARAYLGHIGRQETRKHERTARRQHLYQLVGDSE